MALLISPKLIPLIDYSTTGECDRRGHWIPDLSRPMTIKNKWGDMLEVQGKALALRLHKIATIYRNADEKIDAVPRELLAIHAIAEVGCLRGTISRKSQTGLIFQMNTRYCVEWNLSHGEWGLMRTDVQNGRIKDWGLVGLTPNATIGQDGFFLTTPDADIEEARMWGGDRCSYHELVEREFA